MDLSAIPHEAVRDCFRALEYRTLNHLTSNPVLAVGTDTNEFKVSAFTYKLNGVTYNKAAQDDVAEPLTTTEADEFVKELIVIDSAGTVSLVAGEVAESQAEAELPETPEDKLPIGYIEVPASFTPGTSNVTTGMLKDISETVDVTYA